MLSKATDKLEDLLRDKRRKLTDEDKEEIAIKAKVHKQSLASLAREYGVSRRTIQFVVYPERLTKNREKAKKRGGWRRYYDKDKAREATRKYLARQRELLRELKKIAREEDADD